MSADTFDSPVPSCPICHRNGAVKLNTVVRGLLTCQHCQERLVVSWSGHYVRDPFTLRHLTATRMLRRESHPIARILRDFGLNKSAPFIAIASGVVLLGILLPVLGGFTIRTAPSPITSPAADPYEGSRSPS